MLKSAQLQHVPVRDYLSMHPLDITFQTNTIGYYHCTGHKGKCPEKYVREEEMAIQFGAALQAIHLDGEVLEWMATALKASHSDTKRYHDEMSATFQKQY